MRHRQFLRHLNPKTERNNMTEIKPGLWVREGTLFKSLSEYRLIAFDMDSTLVDIETLDVLAELAGHGEQVAAMTESAMQGEALDYETSLRARVALLKGLPSQLIDTVYEQRLGLNPGVEKLIHACKQVGMRCILVTGGFTCFAERLQKRLGLDDVRANVLEVVDGVVTGRLLTQSRGGIVDAAEKRRMLLDTCSEMGISPELAIACGDGANDLQMLGAAGVGVAFHGKLVVRAQADIAIDQGGMDRLLEVLV